MRALLRSERVAPRRQLRRRRLRQIQASLPPEFSPRPVHTCPWLFGMHLGHLAALSLENSPGHLDLGARPSALNLGHPALKRHRRSVLAAPRRSCARAAGLSMSHPLASGCASEGGQPDASIYS
eukprot:SAG31_NODE_5091_length_2748_cov_16.044923_5_plen_123_part_01